MSKITGSSQGIFDNVSSYLSIPIREINSAKQLYRILSSEMVQKIRKSTFNNITLGLSRTNRIKIHDFRNGAINN